MSENTPGWSNSSPVEDNEKTQDPSEPVNEDGATEPETDEPKAPAKKAAKKTAAKRS